MDELIKKNLYSKHKLYYNENGKFKILMFSDVQERVDFDKKTLKHINYMLDKVKPDLVILGGDQCMGPDVHTVEDFKKFLSVLVKPLEERKIPWMHVFGNHDYDLEFDPFLQQKFYEEYSFCISKHTDNISGVTNYMVPIYKHNSNEICFNIWGLDTQQKSINYFTDFNVKEINKITTVPLGMGAYDTIRFDQIMWYWQSSIELEKFAGKKIPSLMCMHVAPPEFAIVVNNPDECNLIGHNTERIDSSILNSGIFSTIIQRGDVICISCGHTHRNNFSSELYGIKLCLDATAGFTCYGEDVSRGGRVFELSEENPDKIVTYPFLYKEIDFV